MSLITRILNKDDYAAWNSFVDANSDGTIFHKTTWLEHFDPELKVVAIFRDDEMIAGAALASSVKKGVRGLHIPPYTQYFSPLYRHEGSRRPTAEEHDCISAILEEIRDVKQIDFKLPRGHQSILPYHWKGFESTVRLTYIITGTLEEYLDNLNKNKLRELKKLLALVNSGELIIEEDISEQDLQFLMKQTMERKGFDGHGRIAAKLVKDADKSYARKFAIRSKAHGLLAFGFFPYDKKAVYNLVNVSVRINDPVLKTVNLLLLYQAIEFSLNSKRVFDFEGSMLPGVEAFNRLMGGVQAPAYRVQKSSSWIYSLLRAANQIRNDRKKT